MRPNEKAPEARPAGLSGMACWRRGRDSNPRWGLAHTRFPGVRLKPLIHLSERERVIVAAGLRRPACVTARAPVPWPRLHLLAELRAAARTGSPPARVS